ncbi:HOP2 protein, partial [Turnix velox]|nr:HOP2 protein [Turnix velox]
AQQGHVREKAYGKQRIYFAAQVSSAHGTPLGPEPSPLTPHLPQEQLPAASDAELRRLDGDIAALAAQVQALQQSIRQMEAELKELNGSMTNPEMGREIEQLRQECTSYTERLERIKSATDHVSPEEKAKARSCFRLGLGGGGGASYQPLYWATELLEAVLEGYPKSKKQFFEEVGIETDEDHNVTLPGAV